MPTPLDIAMREGPTPARTNLPEHRRLARMGIDMRCYYPRAGKAVCRYDTGPKHEQIVGVILPTMRRFLRDALSSAPTDRAVLDRWLLAARESIGGRKVGIIDWLEALRAVIWSEARYRDDPPGVDTVKMPHVLAAEGEGDCVSFTIAMSALALHAKAGPVKWRIGGGAAATEPGGIDANKHIWPVVGPYAVEMTMQIPVGTELPFEILRDEMP